MLINEFSLSIWSFPFTKYLTTKPFKFIKDDDDAEDEPADERRYEGAGIDRDLIDLLERDIVQAC